MPAATEGSGEDEQTAREVMQPVNAGDVLERLAVALLEAKDFNRAAIAQALGTLAMAPDSTRTLEALRKLLA